MQLQGVWKVILFCLFCCLRTQPADGARILAPFFFPSRSHFMMTSSLIRELIHRGHEVTFITPISLAKEQLGGNYTEILLPQYDFWTEVKETFKVESIFEFSDTSTINFIQMLNLIGLKSTDFAFEQPVVKEIIHAPNKVGKFDLLLTEQFYNEPALVLGYLYKIPSITVSTFGFANHLSQMVGIMSPWSYVPHLDMPLTDHMSFWERIANTYMNIYEDLSRKFVYFPAQDKVLRRHFSHLPEGAPTVDQLQRNISALLLNNHVPLVSARPISFNMVSVGGLHIVPPKPLPAPLQKFLDEARDGVIYFNLGSQLRSADLPPEKLEIFLKVFGGLNQRVLWKFEDENLPNLPANVKVQKWMPQNDVLAHANVKVFITHGGLFGTQEAVHYGVPMLGMPVYCDQHLNINNGKAAGYALGIDYRSITESSLKSLLLELLENPKYRTHMAQASRVFRDRPISAMDTAMYWIDYVIAHRGAPHLIAAGLDLPWYQFYLLDVVAFSIAVVTVPIILACVLLRKLLTKRNKAATRTHKKAKKH